MSADNVTYCPKCKLKNKVAINKARKELQQSYGKVPAEEFVARQDKLKELQTRNDDTTLREDYTCGLIYTSTGDDYFLISYYASCNKCGFQFQFRETKSVAEVVGHIT